MDEVRFSSKHVAKCIVAIVAGASVVGTVKSLSETKLHGCIGFPYAEEVDMNLSPKFQLCANFAIVTLKTNNICDDYVLHILVHG